MPFVPSDLRTGGALQGAVAASLVRQREAAAELAPGTRIGIYRVLQELARGGMAIVYLAERADGEYEQQVALKWMLQAQPDAASEALFRRERQALADLRHPNIARLLDGGRSDEGRPWFAMELIAGERLDTHCVRAGLSQGHRLILFQQVCAAVAFAHARGVIHRDIKPSNVLVDADGSAKLLDFGIAQLLGQDDALAIRAYTPGFASPEQVRGEALTVASDVYQLGRLLASLLSAHTEEQATIAARTATTVALNTESANVSLHPSLPAGLQPDLVAILRKACAADPLQRYASAETLADDVTALIERRPVAARPRRVGYIATRFLQRHPVAIGLSSLALLTLIATLVAFTWRLAQERDRARLEADRAQAGEGFLVSLFRISDSGLNAGRNLNTHELLDRGARQVAADTHSSPGVRIHLLQILARVSVSLGEYDQAQELLIRAFAEADTPALRVPLWAQQLSLLQRRGETAKAVALAPTIIADIPADAEFDTVRAHALNTAARAAAQSGDKRAAAWQALAMIAARRAEDIGQQGYALRTQAFLQELAGDSLAAVDSTSQAVILLTRALGTAAPEVFSARGHHAFLLDEMGESQRALVDIEALHRDSRPALRRDHAAAIYVDAIRSLIYRHNGRLDEALSIGVDTTQRCVKALGENQAQCGHSLYATATALLDLDRPADALPWLERLLRNRRNSMGADHFYTAYAEQLLARAYCLTGRETDGLAIATRTAERFARELRPDDRRQLEAQATRARCTAASAQAMR